MRKHKTHLGTFEPQTDAKKMLSQLYISSELKDPDQFLI